MPRKTPLFVALLLAITGLNAKEGKFINPVTDVCWECMFPITFGSVNVTPGHKDFTKYDTPVCLCHGIPPRPGVPLTFWEPLRLIDVTRHAYKLVGMGGISIAKETVKNRGSVGIVGDGPSQTSFYHVHWYQYPLMALLNLLEDFACVETGEIEAAYMSEFDPTWNDDRLALIFHPEATLFADPAAQTACIADCLTSSSNKPKDSLFWCAGCQGSLYPFTGTVAHHVSPLQASSLLVHRLIAKLHRCRVIKGYGKKDFCQPKYMPIIKKSLYKTQIAYPVPQTKGPCQALGKSDVLWGNGKWFPSGGEDFVYLLWSKKHCCLDAVKMTAGGKML